MRTVYVYIDILPIYTLITWRLYIQNLSLSGDLNPTNIVQRVWNIVNNKLLDVKCLAGGDSELFPSVGLKTCRFQVNVIMIIHDPRIYCLACAARMAACQLLAIKHNDIQQYTTTILPFPHIVSWKMGIHANQDCSFCWTRCSWAKMGESEHSEQHTDRS